MEDFVVEEYLKDLREYGEIVEILPNWLWCVESIGGKGHDCLHFVTFHSSDGDGNFDSVQVSSLFKILGYSESLREGRHTYFPDDGYLFYMNKKHIEAALNHCTKYFDMD